MIEEESVISEMLKDQSLVQSNISFSNVSTRQINLTSKEEKIVKSDQSKKKEVIQTIQGKLTKQEKVQKGKINRGVFWKYFSSGGICLFFIGNFFIFFTVIIKIFADYWVAAWTENQFNLSDNQYILGYGLIILGFFIVGNLRSVIWIIYSTIASMKIFKDLLRNVLKKPTSYFDTTPVGQIINLLSTDTDIIDLEIPKYGLSLIDIGFQFIGIIILSIISNVVILPLIIILFVVMFYAISMYLNLQRATSRLIKTSYSPILSNVIEFYNGILVIRNYNKTEHVQKTFQKNVNILIRIMIHNFYPTCLMNLFNEFLIIFLITAVFVLIVLGVIFQWSFVPQNIGLLSVTMNWVVTIPSFMAFFLHIYSTYIQHMSSAERIFYNVDKDVTEGDFSSPKLEGFPIEGKIEVNNIKVRYREGLPLVLNGVSFSVKPREKIGIVGRSGSGKSSLLLALTRLLDVENSRFYPQVQYDQKIGPYSIVNKKKQLRPLIDKGTNSSIQISSKAFEAKSTEQFLTNDLK